jgi:hypothetical protein
MDRALETDLPEAANPAQTFAACTRETSPLRRRSTGVSGTPFKAGDGGPSTSCRWLRCAPYARSKAASPERRSRITIRGMAAITTRSCLGRSARSASNAIKAHGRSISAAIATTSTTTAFRPTQTIRSIGGVGALGRPAAHEAAWRNHTADAICSTIVRRQMI